MHNIKLQQLWLVNVRQASRFGDTAPLAGKSATST